MLYYLLVQQAENYATLIKPDTINTDLSNEINVLSKILELSNDSQYAANFNLTPALSLNCNHLYSSKSESSVRYDAEIDCTILDQIDLDDSETRESLNSGSKSCMHSRRSCIQDRFKEILLEHYHPFNSTGVFFFKQPDVLNDLSPDYDAISFQNG